MLLSSSLRASDSPRISDLSVARYSPPESSLFLSILVIAALRGCAVLAQDGLASIATAAGSGATYSHQARNHKQAQSPL